MRIPSIRSAFTLIEVLVCTGIITLLVGILLPTVSAVRRHAVSVACLSRQGEVARAAFSYATSHGGFFPLCGEVAAPKPSVIDNGALAAALNDRQQRRYRFATCPDNPWLQQIVPIDLLLTPETARQPLDGSAHIAAAYETSGDSVSRLLRCPAVNVDDPAETLATVKLSAADGSATYIYLYAGHNDYAFNGWVMGVDPSASAPAPLAGQVTRVRRGADVVLLTDALPRGGLLVWLARGDHKTATLADVLGEPKLSYGAKFDFDRHRSKVNVTFADGHAETLSFQSKALAFARLES